MATATKGKKSTKRQKSGDKEASDASKETYSAEEVSRAWVNFKPKMPLSYTIASLEAARRKNNP